MNTETFGQRLSRLRRSHHFTQRELAALIGEAVIAPPPPLKVGIRWEAQPAADVHSFRAMWNEGMITRKMARRLGVNLGTIHKVRKRLGLPPRKADIARSGGYASLVEGPE